MLTRTELMLQGAKSELGTDAEALLEKIAIFEKRFPGAYESLREKLSEKIDFDLDDLINLLQTFSEITG